MVLPRTRLWRGTDRVRHRLLNSRAALETMLDWPQRYAHRFMKAFGTEVAEDNVAREWWVVTDYSGIGTPEFALRCLEELRRWHRQRGVFRGEVLGSRCRERGGHQRVG